MTRRLLTSFIGLAVLAALAGCVSTSGSQSNVTTLTVAGASSLTSVLPEIGKAFISTHPNTALKYSFAGSQDIAAQVDAGSPIDVIALAGPSSLEPISSQVSAPTNFTTNKLVIIVPPQNPANVTSLADLATVKVSLAVPDVPAGQYARESLQKAGVSVTPVSNEPDVKSVVTRVSVGGADAGIVYVTDAQSASSEVDSVAIPNEYNVTATYPAATVNSSTNQTLATEFVAFLRNPVAQRLLRDAGFGPKPSP